MAVRPVFLPNSKCIGVIEKNVEFKWFSGYSQSQKQKSIMSLHDSFKKDNPLVENILEASTNSTEALGQALSAFNLTITTKKKCQTFSVESAFQGSKVFENGGPFLDIFEMDSKTAKKDVRIKNSGKLLYFMFFNEKFPTNPKTLFFDWLYINALYQSGLELQKVIKYDAFTDISFNPLKSINCQARSLALYVSLVQADKLSIALQSMKDFKSICYDYSCEHQSKQFDLI